MTLLTHVGRRRDHRGKPVVTYGYRFWFRGRLYERMIGHTASLAREAEHAERRRVEQAWIEGQWGPLAPQLTAWTDAVEKYETAKADKASLAWDQQRLTWWGDFFAGRGCTYLQEISPELIDQGKAQLAAEGKAPATVTRYLAAGRTLCNLAKRRWKTLRDNPFELVDWPFVPTREPHIPSRAQLLALLEAADPDLRAWILTAIQTGLRKGAIAKITRADLDAQPGMLRLQPHKLRPERLLPLPAALHALLTAQAARGPVFPHPFPEERWRALRASVGLPGLWFHHLRHTAGTLLAEAGIGDQIIQRYLGHATPAMVRRYSHPRAPALREAANVLSLATAKRARRR